MTTIVIAISILIKAISFIMVVYTFNSLLSPIEPKGIMTRFYVLHRKYMLLRASLLFVAALILLELGSMLYAVANSTTSVSDISLLLSDVIFLGLTILLSRIYRFKTAFREERT